MCSKNWYGIFVFSQEKPLSTYFLCESRWTKDENGKKLYANISNYSIDGERESVWFVDQVKKYHRTFSTIKNTLIKSDFFIEWLTEPVPTKEMLDKCPEYDDLIHKPDFPLVETRK